MRIETAKDLWNLIPEDWEEAPIYVHDSIHDIEPIERISFHENGDGTRVVLIHKKQLNPEA